MKLQILDPRYIRASYPENLDLPVRISDWASIKDISPEAKTQKYTYLEWLKYFYNLPVYQLFRTGVRVNKISLETALKNELQILINQNRVEDVKPFTIVDFDYRQP